MFASIRYYLVTSVEAALSVFGIRAFYEQPRYRVIEKFGDNLEIRSYPSRLAAETRMDSPDSKRAAENRAFRLLLAYIAGANRGGEKLAMTAPVEQTTEPSLIAMTAPVEIAGRQSNRLRMRFFLPGKLAASSAPQPIDNRVRIVEVAPATLAVLRFSGSLSGPVESERSRQLAEQLKKSAWRPLGTPFVLAYDPPFTIPLLRRNEIAVEVARS